ncbi:MAG TPA: hypothetical protein PLX35_14795 [Cyclobacteriaceae bacterium]|nr:hypothetical protein [Cyclobacteriaceae bacterium]
MTDSLKNVVQAGDKGHLDAIDLLDKVNSFYNSAWDKLLVLGSVIFAVGSIIVPIIVQWYQKKTLQLKEDILKKEIELGIEKAKRELSEELTKQLNDRTKEYENRIERLNAEANAKAFHLQGNLQRERGQMQGALGDFIVAAKEYWKCGDFPNLQSALGMIGDFCVPLLSLEEINDLAISKNVDLNKLLNELEQDDKQNIFIAKIRDIRLRLTKIPKTQKERLETKPPLPLGPTGSFPKM